MCPKLKDEPCNRPVVLGQAFENIVLRFETALKKSLVISLLISLGIGLGPQGISDLQLEMNKFCSYLLIMRTAEVPFGFLCMYNYEMDAGLVCLSF